MRTQLGAQKLTSILQFIYINGSLKYIHLNRELKQNINKKKLYQKKSHSLIEYNTRGSQFFLLLQHLTIIKSHFIHVDNVIRGFSERKIIE